MLALALILDAWLGEPGWLWQRISHPIVAIGGLISRLDRWLNKGGMRQLRGVFAVCALLTLTLPLPVILYVFAQGWILEIIGAAILLAHRSLVDHVLAVADALDRSLADGRHAVSQIVGRDPETLDETGVCRAAIESAAENFSDGVIAPAFWFALAGLPGIVAYKAVNTADSMIGHMNARYRDFGWAAARLDDLMNWIPARMTGYLFLAAGGRLAAARRMHRDAPGHRSPNAGWPEAAMASVLDVALAGPRVYGGALTDDPFMNPDGRHKVEPDDIRAAVRLLWRAWAAALCIAAVVALIRFVV